MNNKFLDKEGLTKVIRQGKEYVDIKDDELKEEIDAAKTEMSNIKKDFNSSNNNINNKLEIIDENVKNIGDKTDSVNNKVDEIKNGLNNGTIGTCNGHPDGNVIKINDVTQYEFDNVKEGEMIEIPNNDLSLNYLIDCFCDASIDEKAVYRDIVINTDSENIFYDSNYLTITDNGIALKNTITKDVDKIIADETKQLVVYKEFSKEDISKTEKIIAFGEQYE